MPFLIAAIAILVIVAVVLYVRKRPEPFTGINPAMLEEKNAEITELRQQLEQANLRTFRIQDEAALALKEERHRLQLEWAETKRADRKASNERSRSALVAKIAEHMAPFLPGFAFNPKDARHIGELIDFIVYDGLEDGEIREVVFLEVKTRRTGRVSNPRERLLKEAIDAGRVSYRVFVPEVIRKQS